jgi:hypothetical protein
MAATSFSGSQSLIDAALVLKSSASSALGLISLTSPRKREPRDA